MSVGQRRVTRTRRVGMELRLDFGLMVAFLWAGVCFVEDTQRLLFLGYSSNWHQRGTKNAACVHPFLTGIWVHVPQAQREFPPLVLPQPPLC